LSDIKENGLNIETTLSILAVSAGYGIFSITFKKQVQYVQIYLLPFFHIESKSNSVLEFKRKPINWNVVLNMADSIGDSISIALFWFLHPRFSMVSYIMHYEDSEQNCHSYSNFVKHEVTFYIMFLYYIDSTSVLRKEKHVNDNSTSKCICFLWFIHPNLSLIQRYMFLNNFESYKLTYIMPLFFLESDKRVVQGIYTHSRTIALLWLFHKYLALFFYSDDSRVNIYENLMTENAEELVDVEANGIVVLNVAQEITRDRKKFNDYWSYIPILYYIESTPSKNMLKFSMFWLIVRQASFIRYNKETGKEVKFIIFPLFKYGRKSAEWSKWCLFPIVPIKYSYILCLLAREKTVLKMGALNSDGVEDKSLREEDLDVRFLYRIIRYKHENGESSFEWNPFYAFEKKDDKSFSSWDCLGGCLGQRKVSSRDKECRCCCFFYF